MKFFMFDAYGTLFDVHSAVNNVSDDIATHIGRDNVATFSQLWRTKQLEYTWVRCLNNAPYRNFDALTADALTYCFSCYAIDDTSLKQQLLDSYKYLNIYDDAYKALHYLHNKGHYCAIFSNGCYETIAGICDRKGILPYVNNIITLDNINLYKTHPNAYYYAMECLGVQHANIINFFSSNRWDIAGSSTVGFNAYWVNRYNAYDEYDDLLYQAQYTDLSCVEYVESC